MSNLAAAVLGLLALACSEQVTLRTAFDEAEVEWSRGRGLGHLQGTAVLRQRDGDTRTCAALPVYLVPVSAYAVERMQVIYGSTKRGFRHVRAGDVVFDSDDPAYDETTRHTVCDAEGRFEFDRIPAGLYFVTTAVVWEAPLGLGSSREGGSLMQRVRVDLRPTNVVLGL